MPSRYNDNSISRVSLEDDGFKTKKLYLNSTPTIKPIDVQRIIKQSILNMN